MTATCPAGETVRILSVSGAYTVVHRWGSATFHYATSSAHIMTTDTGMQISAAAAYLHSHGYGEWDWYCVAAGASSAPSGDVLQRFDSIEDHSVFTLEPRE